MGLLQQTGKEPDASATLGKAVVRAADLMGLSQTAMAEVLGVRRATAWRRGGGRCWLAPARRREWEVARLFVRPYRSRAALVGNAADARLWLRNENRARGVRRLDLIRGAEGLVRVLQYL